MRSNNDDPHEQQPNLDSNTATMKENDMEEIHRHMIRITGGFPADPSVLGEMQLSSTPSRNKFLRFIPSKVLQRRQALLRRLQTAKDFFWALTALIVIPMGMLLPFIHASSDSLIHSSITKWTTIIVLILALITSWSFNRLLYKTRAGGPVGQSQGDQARHVAAAVLWIIAPLSMITVPLTVGVIRIHTNMTHFHWIWYCILFVCTLSQIYNHFKIWFWRRRLRTQPSLDSLDTAIPTDADMTSAGRRILYKQLVVTCLDILSRTLRHKSFASCVTRILLLQFLFIAAWATSLFRLLHHDPTRNILVLIFINVMVGLWGTIILRRILGYIASGATTLWLETQHNAALVGQDKIQSSEPWSRDSPLVPTARGNSSESYGMLTGEEDVDVVDNDDDDDDDDESDEEEMLETVGDYNRQGGVHANMDMESFNTKSSSSWFHPVLGLTDLSLSIGLPRNITLRTLFFGASTLSFGSVALCAASSTLSQLLLQFMMTVDNNRCRQESKHDSDQDRLRPMTVGLQSNQSHSIMNRIESSARFVTLNYSVYSLGHVAAYVKSYRSASHDVMIRLMETELIFLLVDDISSHVCSSVSFVLAGICTLFSSFVFQFSEKQSYGDDALCSLLFISFALSYFLIDTVMEPIRVCIQSMYVSLAFHPYALRHSFPLLYQRLNRITRPNINMV